MPERPIDNERKACDAVARCLEDLAGGKRANAYSPEDDKLGPPIEYAFDLGEQQHAVEHTIVEAFPSQIHTNVNFDNFITPITNLLDRNMPKPGMFQIAFPIHPTKGMKPSEIVRLQDEIVRWVEMAAVELHNEFPIPDSKNRSIRGRQNSREIKIDGVDVRLSRDSGWYIPDRAQGRLLPIRMAPKNYEDLRRVRLKKAMDKKLPKLKKWRDTGARSVLVLENGDMALSNHVAIFEAAEHALEGRVDQPDEIWLVDTTIETEWTVMCLMRAGVPFPDDESAVRYRDFNPDLLTSV